VLVFSVLESAKCLRALYKYIKESLIHNEPIIGTQIAVKNKEPELTFEQKQAVLNTLWSSAVSGDTLAAIHLSKTFLKTERVQIEVGPKLPQYSREQLIDLLRDYEDSEEIKDPPLLLEKTNTTLTQHVGLGSELNFSGQGMELLETPHSDSTPPGERTPVPPETPVFRTITVGSATQTVPQCPQSPSVSAEDPTLITVGSADSVLTSDSRDVIDRLCERIAASHSVPEPLPPPQGHLRPPALLGVPIKRSRGKS
jgi:hypothetical protein